MRPNAETDDSTDRELDQLQQFKQYLKHQHGNRIAVSQQKLQNTEIRQAVQHQGAASAFRQMILTIERLEDEHEMPDDWPTELDEAYINISECALAVERTANSVSKDKTDDNRGWH